MPQLKSCTQDSLLEELDEYNIEVIYRQLAVNSVCLLYTSSVQRVTIVSGHTATVTFNHPLKRGSLEIIKNSEDNLVEGVKFHLYGNVF